MKFHELLSEINRRFKEKGKPEVSPQELIITVSVLAAQKKIGVQGDNIYLTKAQI